MSCVSFSCNEMEKICLQKYITVSCGDRMQNMLCKIPYIHVPLANDCLITMKYISTLAINNSCTITFRSRSMLLCISHLSKIYGKIYTLYIM